MTEEFGAIRMDQLEKQFVELKGNHDQLSLEFNYHKREFEEVKKELKVLGSSLQEISSSIRMIKYVGLGAFAMYMFQSTGVMSGFAKILAAL